MFTGLITHLGKITRCIDGAESRQLKIDVLKDNATFTKSLGASICCNGICLTANDVSDRSFTVDVSLETLNQTTAKDWCEGQIINLENSLKLGDELGGHFVFGHVDCVSELSLTSKVDTCYQLKFKLPETLQKLVAPKGSISINGISLTVNNVNAHSFEVMIIPHTWTHTTLQYIKAGDKVNLEADMLARYVAQNISC